MSLESTVGALMPLAESELASALVTVILSAPIAAYVGLRVFRHQAKELLDGAVTWQWTHGYNGKLDEEPYLSVQNRSLVAAFVVRARYLKGLFFRTEAKKYPFNYDELTEGNYPLEIKAGGVTSFPLSMAQAVKIADKAGWWSRWLGYALKRNYLWIEVITMSGHRLVIPANDAAPFRERPRWLSGRWLK